MVGRPCSAAAAAASGEGQKDITCKLACSFDFHNLLSISENLNRKIESETYWVGVQCVWFCFLFSPQSAVFNSTFIFVFSCPPFTAGVVCGSARARRRIAEFHFHFSFKSKGGGIVIVYK